MNGYKSINEVDSAYMCVGIKKTNYWCIKKLSQIYTANNSRTKNVEREFLLIFTVA